MYVYIHNRFFDSTCFSLLVSGRKTLETNRVLCFSLPIRPLAITDIAVGGDYVIFRRIYLGWTSPSFGYGRICPHNISHVHFSIKIMDMNICYIKSNIISIWLDFLTSKIWSFLYRIKRSVRNIGFTCLKVIKPIQARKPSVDKQEKKIVIKWILLLQWNTEWHLKKAKK